jgi:hypothetical protein
MTTRRQTLHLIGGAVALSGVALLSSRASAKGNLAHDPVHLPELKIDTVDLKFSQAEYQLETGKYYWLTISSDGEEEDIAFMAPKFFSSCWIDQVVSGDDNVNEVHAQSIYSLEFDGEGSMIVQFIPIRQGEFPFFVEGYENKGLSGKFVVS